MASIGKFPLPPSDWLKRIRKEEDYVEPPPPPPIEARQQLKTTPVPGNRVSTPVKSTPILKPQTTVTPTKGKLIQPKAIPIPAKSIPTKAIPSPIRAKPIQPKAIPSPIRAKPISTTAKPIPTKAKPIPARKPLQPLKPNLIKPISKLPTMPPKRPHPLEGYDINAKLFAFTRIAEFARMKEIIAIRNCCKSFREQIKVEIKLKSHQIDHMARVQDIITREQSYIDTSPKGAGKTFHVLYIAKKFGLKLMVICENNMQSTWEMLAKIHEIDLIQALSYDTLRGTCKSDLKHAWLTRDGEKFFVTQEFKDEVECGMLLVFDEVQKLRNDTTQFKAGLALTQYIYNPETNNADECVNSRVALVSALPCNTDKSIVNMLKLLGLISEEKLARYNRSRKLWEPEGLYEVYTKACKYDMETADEIYQGGALSNKKHAEEVCALLFSLVLMDRIGSSTPEFELTVQKDCSNAFFRVNDKVLVEMKNNMEKLKESLIYNKETKEYEWTKTTQGLLFKILPEIEAGKADVFIEETIRILTEHKTAKVLLFINYHKGIDKVVAGLDGWPVAVITGHVPPATRLQRIREFQEHNSKLRVLITNTQVCGTGVSLDDTHGDYPRHCLLSPSYNFINIDQATGRTWRANTKSDVSITLVYIQQLEEEQAILNSLATKSDKARSFVYDSSKTVFPGEYRVRHVN